MAIEYQGVTFVPKTAQENALVLLNDINQKLLATGVKDTAGNQAVIYVNAASPIWLILFAVGAFMSVFQNLVQAAANSLSITDCSDQQLLNLAQLAGTVRIAGTKTILFVKVTATSAGCTITPSDLIKYTDAVSFAPITTTVIAADGNATIEVRATEVGSFVIVPGQITSFVSTPAGVLSVVNETDSIPGTDIESYAALRKRLQKGASLLTSLDAAILAIRNLDGIEHCNIFFNPSITEDLTLPGSIVIPPRTAAVYVYGTSDRLAETFFTYMLSESMGTETQDYVTEGGQTLTMNYNDVALAEIYVKVMIEADSGQTNYLAELKTALLAASGSLNVGVNYTQQYLLNYLDNFTYAKVIGLYISMDNITWSDITDLDGNELGILTSAKITAEEK